MSLEKADTGTLRSAWIHRLWGASAGLQARLRGKTLVIHPVTIWNYVQLLSGSVVRLVLSLLYFLALTRSLAIADFGFFAGAVAVGTILARLAAFGYGANLLQISATRRRTLGHYCGIYGVWLVASMPLCFMVAYAVYLFSFGNIGKLLPYMAVIAAEALVWRMIDTISAVNSGLGRFGYATAAYNVGTAGRAVAALLFLAASGHDLANWTLLYLLANVASLGFVIGFLKPKVRIRYRSGTVLLRWRDALALGGAGLASSAQMEIDKVLVLTFGGAVTAGLYAICIRIIDLTAVPIRAFNVVMIQRVLTNPDSLAGRKNQVLVEVAIAIAATSAFGFVMLVARIRPDLLGQDIARASGLFGLLWAVPALRNLAEYQAELLYAHGRMVVILWLALLLTSTKTSLMAIIFWNFGQGLRWVAPMSGVFLVNYVLSAAITYRALRPSGRKPPGVPT